MMLNVHEFLPDSTVIVDEARSPLLESQELEVERLWQAEQARRGKPLTNGKILSATEVSTRSIVGRAVEYRYLIAQRASPSLFDILQVRPVAVSGLLECKDGIVFGHRSGATTEGAGFWELVPSGGLDISELAEGDTVDYRAQLLVELYEEVGMRPDLVSTVRPVCLVEDLRSHVLDIALMIETPLTAREVLDAYDQSVTTEYDGLRIVKRAELDAFMKSEASQLVAVSPTLIEQSRRFMQR